MNKIKLFGNILILWTVMFSMLYVNGLKIRPKSHHLQKETKAFTFVNNNISFENSPYNQNQTKQNKFITSHSQSEQQQRGFDDKTMFTQIQTFNNDQSQNFNRSEIKNFHPNQIQNFTL